MIGRSCERGSGISVQAVRHDDDDDDDDISGKEMWKGGVYYKQIAKNHLHNTWFKLET